MIGGGSAASPCGGAAGKAFNSLLPSFSFVGATEGADVMYQQNQKNSSKTKRCEKRLSVLVVGTCAFTLAIAVSDVCAGVLKA